MTRRGIHAVVLILWSALLLSIGITKPWRLVHEDNGAMHTGMALSHTREGIAATRAHNWLVPKDGTSWFAYPHHPPGVPLLIAGAFRMTGVETPAVARAVVVAISIANVLLIYAILSALFADAWAAFAGALFVATIPMQSFFGRMVNFEPPTLLFVLILLLGYMRWSRDGSRAAMVVMAAAVPAGLLFDWPILFFATAIVIAVAVDWLRGESGVGGAVAVAAGAIAGMMIALAHIAFAFGSFERLGEVLGKDVGLGHDPLRITHFVPLMFENYRHYFTATGLVTGIVAAVVAFRRNTPAMLRRLLLITGGAALAYVLASPNRARLHHYWQFYFLPYAAVAFTMAFVWLRARRARAVIGLMVLEIALATGYKLYRRHTEPGEYAVRAIEHLERLYLTP